MSSGEISLGITGNKKSTIRGDANVGSRDTSNDSEASDIAEGVRGNRSAGASPLISTASVAVKGEPNASRNPRYMRNMWASGIGRHSLPANLFSGKRGVSRRQEQSSSDLLLDVGLRFALPLQLPLGLPPPPLIAPRWPGRLDPREHPR